MVTAGIASVTRLDDPDDGCPDGRPVATVDGLALCTHGPDRGDLGATADSLAPESGPTPERALACIGNGTSGARVQAVYARPAGRPDRYGALRPSLEAAAAEVEHLVDRSAAQTRGERHVRWATTTRPGTAGCELDIARVSVAADAGSNFGGLVRALDTAGLDRHDRKYLVWVDTATTTCSGIATHLDDDRPGQNNYNNTSVGYARVDDSCLARRGAVETHELMHLLGAVQRSAPNVSPEGHCRDEWDLLCYDEDGSGPFRTTVRCPTTANDRRLDCRHDDYFSTAPPPGSYLATHWNAADSRYLEDGPPVVVPGGDPPPNDAFASAPVLAGYTGTTPGTLAGATVESGEPGHAAGTTGSIWYKWRPRVDGPVSVDTRGSDGDTALDVYTGTALGELTRVATNDDAVDLAPQSRVTFTAVAGTTYRIAVTGRAGARVTELRWGPPPHGLGDVTPGTRVDTAVGWAVAFGVLPGYADNTWRPRHAVNRGQGVATLWRMFGRPRVAIAPPTTTTTTSTSTASTSTTSTTRPSTTTTTTRPSSTTSTTTSSTSTSPTSGADAAVGPIAVAPHAASAAGDVRLPFTDVGADAGYRRALEWAVTSGVVPRSTTFRPDDPLARADLVTWAWAAVGRPAGAGTTDFRDVSATAPYRPALAWATEHHLVAGFADGTFRPATTVTRARLALGLFALARDPRAWTAVPGGDPPPTVVF